MRRSPGSRSSSCRRVRPSSTGGTCRSMSICFEVGRRATGRVLVLPPIPYGLNLHHIDFPGTIHIEPEVFIAFCLNITKSVAYHGFEKVLIINGHGSNVPLIDIIARRTTLQTDSLCAAVHYIWLAV